MDFRDKMNLSGRKSDYSLAILLIQLEEVEEQIEGLQLSRLELIDKILSQGNIQAAVKDNGYSTRNATRKLGMLFSEADLSSRCEIN